MTVLRTLLLTALLVTQGAVAFAQADDSERLKITALEALVSAPPERALPIVSRVLNGDGSDELKERALFVLGHIELPEAQAMLADFARTGEGEIRLEAIRMIGISGNSDALEGLYDIYSAGDENTKEAVLEAYLIADDKAAVYRIAANTDDPDELENAVEMLGAMGASEELHALRDRPGMAEILVDAYAIAGDVDSLAELARDGSNPERQAQAIRGLGVTGGDEVSGILVETYRNSNSPQIKEAALEGLLIADDDDAVLSLFRNSSNEQEKSELLETLIMMDSEAVWDIVDATLEDGE